MVAVKSLVNFLKQQKDKQLSGDKISPKSILPSHSTSSSHQSELIVGLSSSARALSIAEKYASAKCQMLVVTANMTEAYQLASDLSALVSADEIFLYPFNDLFHAQMSISSPESQAERVQTLDYILSGQPGIIIATVASLRKIIAPKELFVSYRLEIHSNSTINLETIAEQLVVMGYKREQLVASSGEFSIRGGIIDIFPLGEEYPIRIELFGDEIDSMRRYDSQSQRSLEEIDSAVVLPFTDLLINHQGRMQAVQILETLSQSEPEEMKDDEDKVHWQAQLDHWRTLLLHGEWTDEFQAFAALFYSKKTSLLDYLSSDAIIIFDEYTHLKDQSQKINQEKEDWLSDKPIHQLLDEQYALIYPFEKITSDRRYYRIYYSLFRRGMGQLKFDRITDYTERPIPQFFGQLDLLQAELDRYKKLGYTVIVMAQSSRRLTEIQNIFQEYNLPKPVSEEELQEDRLQIVPYTLQNGFEWSDLKLAILTEKELFNHVKKHRIRRRELTNAERLKDYTDLKVGDYVVHVHHGIGRYLGIETLEIKGVHQDYLLISYRNDDKVYVPVDQLGLVQKYVSSEGKTPIIHKLGGTKWAKTKARVSKQVEDIADELLDIYAERESRQGYAYPPIDSYYHEFENDFPYTETPDQLRSIKEVNQDLSQSKPMDRLLVGDVGYGKTEVAMRAAFRVVQEGRQVAFLVPTTVLAQQHYDTLRERFEGYPVSIQVLSRFKTAKESKQIIADLAKGKIDIIIGTHRLLSKDVHFKQLGLLIIDEEQRFGVKHKERIKKIKAEVDVLTLTATPIPRTLHMSIVGARDLSLIETPPANRFPVQTHVLEMNEMIIREAIEREIDRGGQVFYLHNRVETIEKRVHDLEQLVPEARVAYAHGQMSEVQLENILYAFINREYDVLVTTTIIETGVDIPNANTLLIENADRMGLSQLYQLRGRVGRSNRVAYAYLMYEPNKSLTEESEKRLKAIQDFTELGSGFKIAMRDLSIRGAGNLLGSQQSGFIDSVGFDLYSQMLAETIARKQGKIVSNITSAEIDLPVDAYIPSDYIADEAQKIEMYKKVRAFVDEQDYVDLQDELIDRFGDYPQPVAILLQIGLLKMYGDQAHVEKISQNGKNILVSFSADVLQMISVPDVFKSLKDIPLKVDISADPQLELTFLLPQGANSENILTHLIDFLRELIQYMDSH